MDREILFRAKDINNNWVYGSYFKHIERQICPIGNDSLKEEDIEHLMIRDSFADWNMPKEIECVRIKPDTVGQYIEIKDKNDVEVYEGDIIKFNYYGKEKISSVIEYSMGVYGFFIDSESNESDDYWTIADLIANVGKDFEVVGNIYENKELLESEE